MSKQYYVYILTNTYNKVLYIGVTNNIVRRLEEHRGHFVKGFSSKYKLHKLVYIEQFDDPITAISREKELKGWIRQKKDALISSMNPKWEDLALSLFV